MVESVTTPGSPPLAFVFGCPKLHADSERGRWADRVRPRGCLLHLGLASERMADVLGPPSSEHSPSSDLVRDGAALRPQCIGGRLGDRDCDHGDNPPLTAKFELTPADRAVTGADRPATPTGTTSVKAVLQGDGA